MLPDGFQALVILPARFRKQIWIRKGSFLIVEVIQDEEKDGERVFNGEIVRVLLKDDEKHLRALDGGTWWPERWSVTDDDRDTDVNSDQGAEEGGEKERGDVETSASASSSEDELPEHLQRVPNRRRSLYRDDDDSSDDSD